MKKDTKKILKTVGVIGATATATYFAMGNIFYYIVLHSISLK